MSGAHGGHHVCPGGLAWVHPCPGLPTSPPAPQPYPHPSPGAFLAPRLIHSVPLGWGWGSSSQPRRRCLPLPSRQGPGPGRSLGRVGGWGQWPRLPPLISRSSCVSGRLSCLGATEQSTGTASPGPLPLGTRAPPTTEGRAAAGQETLPAWLSLQGVWPPWCSWIAAMPPWTRRGPSVCEAATPWTWTV